MDFSNLNNENLLVYAVKAYDNPACNGVKEFNEDMDRIKYVKRLIRRYVATGKLQDRLILNHIIIIYNVFGLEASTRMLFLRMEKALWPVLKTFLVYLSYMPDLVQGINGTNIISSDIQLDSLLVKKLRQV